MPDPTFAKLYDATTGLRPAPTDQVRARGRQRARRQRLAAVAAAIVAVAVVAGGIAVAGGNTAAPPGPPGGSTTPSVTPSTAAPTPSATPSTTPSKVAPLTSVPVAAMLQPADLAPGQWRANDNIDQVGDWSMEFVLSRCPSERAFPSGGGARGNRLRGLHRTGSNQGMLQEMWLFEDMTDAQARFDWYRDSAVACARSTVTSTPTEVTIERVVPDIGADDKAMLIRVTTISDGRGFLYGFVVAGPLVTQFTVYDDEVFTGETLLAKATTRMCAVLGSC